MPSLVSWLYAGSNGCLRTFLPCILKLHWNLTAKRSDHDTLLQVRMTVFRWSSLDLLSDPLCASLFPIWSPLAGIVSLIQLSIVTLGFWLIDWFLSMSSGSVTKKVLAVIELIFRLMRHLLCPKSQLIPITQVCGRFITAIDSIDHFSLINH